MNQPPTDNPADPAPKPRVSSEPLLPPGFFSPLNLLWTTVLPLCLPLFLNLQAFWFLHGELSREQRLTAWAAAGLLLLVMVGAGSAAMWLRRQGKPLTWPWFMVLVGVMVGLLVADLHLVSEAGLPSVPRWLLDAETFLLAQFAGVMPGCFYAAVGLAGTPLRMARRQDWMTTLGVVVGIPVLFYLVFLTGGSGLVSVAPAVGTTFFVVCTAALLVGILRLLVKLSLVLVRWRWLMVLLAALVLPLGGLALNAKIPFPVNFQCPEVYLFTVVNAAVLLAGCVPRWGGSRWLWMAQTATFPFTAYFFIVFLPFLPLSLPAIFAAGAGFLILAPTILFLVHGQELVAGFRREAGRLGEFPAASLLVLMMALAPGFVVLRAYQDRAALQEAVGWVYNPRLEPRTAFTGDLGRIRRGLTNLRDFKEGLSLPLLSGVYNRIVFNDLVLPDEKLNHLHRTFFGMPMPETKGGAMWGAFSRKSRPGRPVRNLMSLPREQAVLEKVSSTAAVDGDVTRTVVRLDIRNDATQQNEFVARLQVPSQALITGYWLHIGEQRVPGRIFERKTALWVYEQIRDVTRRDPGLLRFLPSGRVELRVFPLEPGQKRVTEIEFTWLNPPVGAVVIEEPFRKDGKPWTVAPPPGAATSEEGGLYEVNLPGSMGVAAWNVWPRTTVPAVRQERYFHFIVSRAVEGASKRSEAVARMIEDHVRLAGGGQVKVTVANFESRALTEKPVPANEVGTLLEKGFRELRGRGALDLGRVLKEEIASLKASWKRDDPASFGGYPEFVVVGETPAGWEPDEALRFSLEVQGLAVMKLVAEEGRTLAQPLFVPAGATPGGGRSVGVLAKGPVVRVVPEASSVRHAFFPDAANRSLEAFCPERGFVPVNARPVKDARYNAGLGAWAMQMAMWEHPDRAEKLLSSVVEQSRKSGTLVPATSYIVVENSLQWKALQAKERQKLGAHQELEFQESPEPSVWILMGAAVAAAWWWSRRRRRGSLAA